jgi:hypothetical protein
VTDLADSPAVTVPTEVGQRPFDADNHYYEALDAFTRHLDPAWGPRTIQWSEIDGRKYHVVGGKVSRAVVNPTFDPVAKPGVLRDYFRATPTATTRSSCCGPATGSTPPTATATPDWRPWTTTAWTRSGSSPRSGWSTRRS